MPTTTTHTKDCERCGSKFDFEIPEDLEAASARNREAKAGTDFVAVLLSMRTLCDTCNDKRQKEWDAADADAAAKTHELIMHERLDNYALGTELRKVSFETVTIDDANRAAVGLAKLWAQGKINGLVLGGPVGVGKTYLAAAAANALVQRRAVRWFSASKLMAQARAGFKNPSRDEVTELLIKEQLALVLDDIDKISPTDYALDIFFQIIDSRVNNGTPLLITTNKRYDEIEAQFGEAIASRLSTLRSSRIDGEDRRKA